MERLRINVNNLNRICKTDWADAQPVYSGFQP
jgi:hypothetical protein